MSLPQNPHPSKTDVELRLDIAPATRCCVITGVGRSAVAVVAVEGPDAIPLVARCFRGARSVCLSPGQIRFGAWVDGSDRGSPFESVIVTPRADDAIEIHCHGGPAATARILDDLRTCGATVVDQDRWLRARDPLLICEAKQVLARCVTSRAAGIAMDQVRGAMQGWVVSRLQSMASALAGEGAESSARDLDLLDSIRCEAKEILQFSPLGLRLHNPFRVVLVGPPNVGKSSLLNEILGYERSITFDEAGTTRDVLHAETVIDGWPVRLSDTAGIRESDEPIEREGVVRARSAAEQADLIIYVTEPALLDQHAQAQSLAGDFSRFSHVPGLRILNKYDLWTTARGKLAGEANCCLKDRSSWSNDHPGFDLVTDAIRGKGVAELIQLIAGKLAESVPAPGSPVPITQRQIDLLQCLIHASSEQEVVQGFESLLGPDTVWEEA